MYVQHSTRPGHMLGAARVIRVTLSRLITVDALLQISYFESKLVYIRKLNKICFEIIFCCGTIFNYSSNKKIYSKIK